MSDAAKQTDYPIIGQLALKHSLIKEEELKKAIAACAGRKNISHALEEYLVSKELISETDMKRLKKAAKAIEMRQKDIRFGVIAINLGLINKSLVEMALDEQKKEINMNKKARRIGDILVEAGIISPKQRDAILKEQYRLKKEKKKIKAQAEKIIKSKEHNKEKTKKSSNINENKEGKNGESDNPERESGLLQYEDKDLNTDFSKTKTFPIGIKLIIPENGLAAYILKTEDFDQNTKIKDIIEILEQEKICFGVVDYTLIRGFIKSKAFKDKPFKIASGIEPQPGKNGSIKYYFDTNRLKPGQIDKDGKIDFKDRGKIPYVEKGTLLAEKIPMIKGKDGKNIFGKRIPVKPVTDAKLKYDKGAHFVDNATKMIASISGQPILSWSGVVSVLDEFVTRQDVNYETGHINYKGNIRIRGCVQNGFKVEGNNIWANEVDGGIIRADGDLRINGIISKAHIYSRGNIRAKFIHKSKILCMGDIHITKEIVESKIENSGACIIKRGKIINSRITSKMGVYVKDIGTEISMPSSITTGIDIFILKETENLEKKIYDQKLNLDYSEKKKQKLEENNRKNQDRITMLAQIQDKARLETDNIISKIASLNIKKEKQKIEELNDRLNKLKKTISDAEKKLNNYFNKTDTQDKKIARLKVSIALQEDKLKEFITEKENLIAWSKETPGVAIIKSSGTIMAGTIVAGKHSKKVIKNTISNVTIKEMMVKHTEKDYPAETNRQTEINNEYTEDTKPEQEKQQIYWEMQIIHE